MKYADLHVHTSFSDGAFSPSEVIQHAARYNLSAIAITDHDCVDGISPALDLAPQYGIEVVPGIELSAETENCEVHILGFYVDWKNEWFLQELREICRKRVERIYEMVGKLRQAGVNITAPEVFSLGGAGSVGRLHLATVLFKRGYISSIGEAFSRFIGNNGPCYAQKLRRTPKETIAMIHKVKGIAVLAHPHTMGKDSLIPQLIQDGIRGIEVYYADQSQSTIKKYENLAHKYNLMITGGSDCHGQRANGISMGKVKIPYELVEKLKAESSKLKGK